MANLGIVFEQYADEVVVWVTDPRTGIQRNHKWPPMLSEVVEACDNRAAELARQERYRNWGKGNDLLLEKPVDKRPTVDELKAKYGPDWGIADPPATPPVPAPTWDAIAEIYAADPGRGSRLLRSEQ